MSQQVEIPAEGLKAAWDTLPDGTTHREVTEALQAAAPSIRQQERERLLGGTAVDAGHDVLVERVPYDVRGSHNAEARDNAEAVLRAALAALKEEDH